MKNLLARENAEILAQVAWSRVLLAFDFDGTLAPIVDERDAARMRGETAELFKTLCRLYPCAVITGRAKADVVDRLQRAKVK
jgi:trehalose 6-phosphate phosphatase